MCRDGAEETSAGRSFHVRVPATRKAQHPVGSLMAGTSRSLDKEDRSLCRTGCRRSVWTAIGTAGHHHREPEPTVQDNRFTFVVKMCSLRNGNWHLQNKTVSSRHKEQFRFGSIWQKNDFGLAHNYCNNATCMLDSWSLGFVKWFCSHD